MRKITLLSVFLLLIMVKMSAQVTIGSEGQPASGSLLQLKEDNLTGTNSKKGFGLPRVALTDVAHLYPMFTPGYDVIENVNHEGLMVYNTNPNFGNGRGVYIWQNESSAFSWMSMKTKISVVDKTLAIITKASQRIVARVDDVNPKTSDVTWNGISGNNVDEISIAANGTDIYLPPFKNFKITGYIGIYSTTGGTNATYIATRFALVTGGVADPSKLTLSTWGYAESSTETIDDGGVSYPTCILNTGKDGAYVRLIANGPRNDRNTVIAASTPLTAKSMDSVGTYLLVEEL